MAGLLIQDVSKELPASVFEGQAVRIDTLCAEQIAEACTNLSVRRTEKLPGIRNCINYYFDPDFVSFSVTRSVNVPILKYSCENIII